MRIQPQSRQVVCSIREREAEGGGNCEGARRGGGVGESCQQLGAQVQAGGKVRSDAEGVDEEGADQALPRACLPR